MEKLKNKILWVDDEIELYAQISSSWKIKAILLIKLPMAKMPLTLLRKRF
jgi:hypothetical protein